MNGINFSKSLGNSPVFTQSLEHLGVKPPAKGVGQFSTRLESQKLLDDRFELAGRKEVAKIQGEFVPGAHSVHHSSQGSPDRVDDSGAVSSVSPERFVVVKSPYKS